MDNHVERANILIEALPYIQQYFGKTLVVKYGGNAMTKPELMDAVMSDIALLSLVGIKVVLVHGGAPEIKEMLEKTGMKSEFIDGLRYTDAETMEIVQMVLCGRVNKNLVAALSRLGGRALGLSGLDGGMLKAVLYENGKYGLVGEIVEVDPAPVRAAIEAGYIPVVSTIALGIDDEVSYNINADTAAAKLAVALGAYKLIVLTNVRGLLRDITDENSLISVLSVSEIPKLISEGIISGGTIPKIDCVREAVTNGVARAHIIDGRIPHSILIEILSNEGLGTMIIPDNS